MGEVAKMEPRKAALATGGAVAAMVPTNVEQAWRLAEIMAGSGMTPKSYGNDPRKIMVGMMAGMEIGLTPFAALQSIAVIGNNPSIWGDGALALVQASNLVEDMSETDDGHTAVCTIKRVGRATPIVGKFSMDDAKKAGLAGKSGPWSQYPARMRQMRARAFALRDGFADVLKGLRVAEEVRDYSDFADAKAQPVQPMGEVEGRALLAASLGPDDETDAEPIGEDQDDITPAAVEEATGPAPIDDAGEAAAPASGGLFTEPDHVETAATLDRRYREAATLEDLQRLWAETANDRKAVIRADEAFRDVFAKVLEREKARLAGEVA